MSDLSKSLFESFLEAVVATHVFSNAERNLGSGALTDRAAKDITAGKRIDDRIPYLMTVSGKGGYVPGERFNDREPFRNVTLLDHILSVARGAAVFAELDLRAAGVTEGLAPRLAQLIATGFLHDADKMLQMSRQDELRTADIEALVQRYGIGDWLRSQGADMRPSDLLAMINAVEVTRSDLIKPGMRLLSPQEKADTHYVRLADRLDGLFLDSRKGLEAIIEEIEAFGGFRSPELKRHWRRVHMRAPHTPFLLANFQRGLSAAVRSVNGVPPLLEVHHDGEFLAIFQVEDPEKVIEAAIQDAVRPLSLGMRVDINPKGTRDILDGAGNVEDLIAFLEDAPEDSAKALFIHVDHLGGAASLREQIDELTAAFNFLPDYSRLAKFLGKHYQPWSGKVVSEDEPAWIRTRAAAIAVALGCAEPSDKLLAKAVPDAIVREAELIERLALHGLIFPDWLQDVGKLSRQTLAAIFAAGHASANSDLEDDLFGSGGLLNLWLVGDGAGRRGLVDKIGDPGAALAGAAKSWLRDLMAGTFQGMDEDRAEGRCHFTNMPVSVADRIDGKSGIEGLKVSAFSGREGRPESFSSAKSQTLVAPIAFAEHRLRTLEGDGAGFGKVPAFISSPSMMGLFASLNLRHDRDFMQINQFDLMRLEEKGGKKTWPVTDTYGQRIFFARHFSLPERQVEIIEQIRMMMRSALRMGRPVHVFRGLPTPQNAFFHIDAAPDVIRRAIGGSSLRIEQIRPAIEVLGMIEELAALNGIGLELALRFADPDTRFGAACEALVALDRLPEDKQKQKSGLRSLLQAVTRDKEIAMSQNENVIISFAQAMAAIQEGPRRDTSNNVKTMGLRVALEAVEECVNQIHQTGRDSLIAGIVGKMQLEFERAGRVNWIGKVHGNPFPIQKAMEAATIFVDEVWPIAFSGRSPASKARRIAFAVYQISFETEHRRKFEARRAAQAEAPAADSDLTETTY